MLISRTQIASLPKREIELEIPEVSTPRQLTIKYFYVDSRGTFLHQIDKFFLQRLSKFNFAKMKTTRFSGITLGPPIEVFALNKAFLDDTHEKKVNLTVGGILSFF